MDGFHGWCPMRRRHEEMDYDRMRPKCVAAALCDSECDNLRTKIRAVICVLYPLMCSLIFDLERKTRTSADTPVSCRDGAKRVYLDHSASGTIYPLHPAAPYSFVLLAIYQ